MPKTGPPAALARYNVSTDSIIGHAATTTLRAGAGHSPTFT